MVERGTSYFGVRDPAHAVEDMDRLRERGFDAVLHTFSERDRKYYRETMAEIVRESKERGLTVYVNPWGVGKVFGGEALSQFLANHPDARQRVATGDRVLGACFNSPAFREFMRSWTRDAVSLEPDVLFWDEPHWFLPDWFDEDQPDDAWVCRCEHCRERFEERYDRPMPLAETEAVRQFREESLLEFLEEQMAVAAEADVRNAVCLVPVSDADHGIADWEALAASEHVDVFATDPYWELFMEEGDEAGRYVRDATAELVALADEYGLLSQIWIQGFGLADEDSTYDAVADATRAAVDGGADSVFMWGYDACRSISSIACENPERVWRTYVDALHEA